MSSGKEVIKELIIIDQIIDSFIKNIENINKEKIKFENKRKRICSDYVSGVMGIKVGDIVVFKHGRYKGRELFIEKVVGRLSVVDSERVEVNDMILACRLVEENGCLSNVPKVIWGKNEMDFEKRESGKIQHDESVPVKIDKGPGNT